MSTGGGVILYGVFRSLLDAGMRLGVADYLDAIRALRLELAGAIPGGGSRTRDRLRRICHILWARTADESRLIDAVFKAIPSPSPDQVREFDEAMGRRTETSAEGSSALALSGDTRAVRHAADERQERLWARVVFEPSHESTGIPLPRLIQPVTSSQRFILQPQTEVSERSLAVLWRRFRKLTRTGPKTELDMEGTIADRCRRGVLASPVMRAPRTNRARLFIMLDASPSMAPWQPCLDAIARSLTLSRLWEPGLFYFHNLPTPVVYRSMAFSEGIPIGDVFSEYAKASLLIVGDAGAARGFLNHRRVRETRNYLDQAKRRTRAVVWLNPLPQQRWVGTTAERLARAGGVTFLQLDAAHLIRAVDILRGARSS
jgi:uncharacterized protein